MTFRIESISHSYSSSAKATGLFDEAEGGTFDELLNEPSMNAIDEESELTEMDLPQLSVDETGYSSDADTTSAAEEFIKYVQMSPIQRIRYDYLKSQGLDEDSLSELSPDLRKAIEDEIKKLIEQKLHLDRGEADSADPEATPLSQAMDAA